MALPPSFNNTVRIVTGTPVGTAEINAELATQNLAGYWATSIEFIDEDTAAILFVKNNSIFGYDAPQKVNQVTASQVAVDADKTAETALDYWPTGIFVTPGGNFLILYQQILGSST